MEFGEYGYLASIVLLILGSINHLLSLFSIHIFGNLILRRIFYGIIGVAGVYLMFNRYTYFPLLGPAMMPAGFFKDTNNGKTLFLGPTDLGSRVFKELTNIPEGVTFVQYWTALPNKEPHKNYEEAYGDYKNMGVAIVLELPKDISYEELTAGMNAGKTAMKEGTALSEKQKKVSGLFQIAKEIEDDSKVKGAIEGEAKAAARKTKMEEISKKGRHAVLEFVCPGKYKGMFGDTEVGISYRYLYSSKNKVGGVIETEVPIKECKPTDK